MGQLGRCSNHEADKKDLLNGHRQGETKRRILKKNENKVTEEKENE